MTTMQAIGLILTALLAENFILVYAMGVGTQYRAFTDPVEGRRTGIALTLVMVTAGVLGRGVTLILTNLHLEHFQLLCYALLIPAVSAVLGALLHFFLPELSRRLAEPIRMVTGNAAALGGLLIAAERSYTLSQTFLYTLFAGIGVTVVLMSFAGLREEISFDRCPKAFRGLPITLITGGLMALAMVGYYGLNIG